jgi:hypothetical protein
LFCSADRRLIVPKLDWRESCRPRVANSYQSFWLLRIGFTVAPILFGADKLAKVLVNWEKYLASCGSAGCPG